MTEHRENSWFSLAAQPQEPLSRDGVTLTGRELDAWRESFEPLRRHLAHKEVVLALSGGGMSLPCHVSVLKVLELLSIRVARIAGTSAGAVIGGLYAAGMTTDDLERAMLDIESPDELFGFASKYPGLRLVTNEFTKRVRMSAAAVIRGLYTAGMNEEEFEKALRDFEDSGHPFAATSRHAGARLMANELRKAFRGRTLDEIGVYNLATVESFVERTLKKYVGGIPRMGDLVSDFSCVALDIGTGRPRPGERERPRKAVFSRAATPETSLADAVSASMAIPGVLTPKRMGDRFYIDGGVVEFLPILTALNASRRDRRRRRKVAIIAVDLGYSGEPPNRQMLENPVDLVLYLHDLQNRMITQQNLMRCHRPRRGSSVILVRPRRLPIALHEVEKIPAVMFTAYTEATRQLSGRGFLDRTTDSLSEAKTLLGEYEE